MVAKKEKKRKQKEKKQSKKPVGKSTKKRETKEKIHKRESKKVSKKVAQKTAIRKEPKIKKPSSKQKGLVITLSSDSLLSIDVEKFKKRLLQLREEILAKILKDRKEERERLKEEVIPEPGDESDYAQKEREMEMASIFSHKDKNKLALVEEALKRIEEGRYGICESCGIPIEESRLEVIPFAKYCLQCQELKDREEEIYRETEIPKPAKGTGTLDIPDEEG